MSQILTDWHSPNNRWDLYHPGHHQGLWGWPVRSGLLRLSHAALSVRPLQLQNNAQASEGGKEEEGHNHSRKSVITSRSVTEPSSRLIYPSFLHFFCQRVMTAFSHKLLMQEWGNAWCEAKWIFLKEQEYINAQRRRVNHQTKIGLFRSTVHTQTHFAPTSRFNENNEHLPKAISWLILWKRYERKYFYLRVFFVFFCESVDEISPP